MNSEYFYGFAFKLYKLLVKRECFKLLILFHVQFYYTSDIISNRQCQSVNIYSDDADVQ